MGLWRLTGRIGDRFSTSMTCSKTERRPIAGRLFSLGLGVLFFVSDQAGTTERAAIGPRTWSNSQSLKLFTVLGEAGDHGDTRK